MARMFPEKGPTQTGSQGEYLLYEILQKSLSDDYRVYHSIPWPEKRSSRHPRDYEIDFVIVHPRRGLLVIEVKSGEVARNGTTGDWLRARSDHSTEVITDPFRQARQAMYALRRLFTKSPLTTPFARQYRTGYCVWFPHIPWHGAVAESAIYDPHLILDARAVHGAQQHLEQVFDYTGMPLAHPGSAEELSVEALDALHQAIAPTLFSKSSLLLTLENEALQLKTLTDEQFERLQDMLKYERLAIPGAAGTGKTVLAIEAAWRHAAMGRDVLFLCMGQFLKHWIETRRRKDPRTPKPYFDIHTVRSLCAALGRQAHLYTDEAERTRDQRKLAEILTRCVDRMRTNGQTLPYNVIIVDEGQDIDPPLWHAIEGLLHHTDAETDESEGWLHVFYDEAQRESDERWSLPIQGDKVMWPLTENCRNTRSIFHEMARLNPAIAGHRIHGPEGQKPTFLDPATDSHPRLPGEDVEQAATRHALTWLVEEEQVRPEDILVVTCRPFGQSRWRYTRPIGSHAITWDPDRELPGRVSFVTVRSSKGLERKVVILAELDGIATDKRRNTLLYVAISRAMLRLIVLGPRSVLT